VSFTAGFRPALAVVAGLSFLGAVSALAIGSRRRSAARAVEPVAELAASA
jgi:hypothetical protein